MKPLTWIERAGQVLIMLQPVFSIAGVTSFLLSRASAVTVGILLFNAVVVVVAWFLTIVPGLPRISGDPSTPRTSSSTLKGGESWDEREQRMEEEAEEYAAQFRRE